MKKFLVYGLSLLTVLSLTVFVSGASAATNDFTADGNIEVPLVTFGDGTATMLIMNGSTAESWSFNGGTFQVTNPGTIFKVGSSSSSVKTITSTQGGNTVSCAVNANPGTSYGELPTAAGTYTIVPSTTASCGGGGAAPSGGSSSSSSAPTTYQVSDPNKTVTDKTTTAPKTTTPVIIKPLAPTGDQNLVKVLAESATIAQGTREALLAEVGKIRDAKAESTFNTTVVKNIVATVKTISTEVREKILNFVTYGTPTTQVLGAGERGGVVNSFKEAFGKLPATEADWQDVVKIGNGRWPSQTSATRETKSEAAFKAIYKRAPVRANAKDDAAVVVMAYGLRPANRNLGSEAAASKTFKAVYGKNPATATDWDTVRAIAYSGAKR
ncbi:MAG: hypothetical protein AAB880_00605 [Patescibacteria group bacterium]